VLARTVVVVALVVALAVALLHACALSARARVHRVAASAAAASFDRALASVQAQIASEIAAGDDPRSLPSAMPTAAASCASVLPDGTCALTVTVTIASTTTQPISGSTAGDGCAATCAQDLQDNDAVAEGRLSVRVTSNASGPDGMVFSSRDRYAIFRTTRTAPYASLIGTRDASGEGIATGTSEGEDAGTPARTTVDVRYVNAATGASMEGNAWRSGAWQRDDASATAWEP